MPRFEVRAMPDDDYVIVNDAAESRALNERILPGVFAATEQPNVPVPGDLYVEQVDTGLQLYVWTVPAAPVDAVTGQPIPNLPAGSGTWVPLVGGNDKEPVPEVLQWRGGTQYFGGQLALVDNGKGAHSMWLASVDIAPDNHAPGTNGAATAWQAISGGFDVKPPVANLAALPTVGAHIGAARFTLDTGDLYVWDGSAWSLAGHLKGATGPAGAKGTSGTNGTNGSQGPKGDAGAAGATGGIGPHGTAGGQGPKGDAGAAGATGGIGPHGADGGIGPKGDQGHKGDTGGIGPHGVKGDTGAGIDIKGTVASVAALPIHGNHIGDVHLDVGNGDMYIFTGAGAGSVGPPGHLDEWRDVGHVQGPTGAAGAVGPHGVKGDQGIAGPTGAKGATGGIGPHGTKGDTGAAGTTGAKGATGGAGPHGTKGDAGAVGGTGPKGDPGVHGTHGDPGTAGAAGVGIVSAKVDAAGELQVTMTDQSVTDAGHVVGHGLYALIKDSPPSNAEIIASGWTAGEVAIWLKPVTADTYAADDPTIVGLKTDVTALQAAVAALRGTP